MITEICSTVFLWWQTSWTRHNQQSELSLAIHRHRFTDWKLTEAIIHEHSIRSTPITLDDFGTLGVHTSWTKPPILDNS
jgi:hypothetical protein